MYLDIGSIGKNNVLFEFLTRTKCDFKLNLSFAVFRLETTVTTFKTMLFAAA